ncbi:MAG: DUF1488 family protein [Afipia sp.]|nr:DUF1488 family protein [Afipia sp.]
MAHEIVEFETLIGSCIYFQLLTQTGLIGSRVSISALLRRERIQSIPSLEWLLYIFDQHRAEIENVALQKFQQGNRWLGGSWVTDRDLNRPNENG